MGQGMFRRKAKTAEQGGRVTEGRHRSKQGAEAPRAYTTYYTNRVSEGERQSVSERRERTDQADAQRSGTGRLQAFFSVALFWVLIAVVAVCAGKVLLLSTDPKVLIVGQTHTTAVYTQSAEVYEAAAQKLLATSVTNRSKLTMDSDGVARQLEAEFPELQAVSVSIPLVASRPVVYVQPASPSLVLKTTRGNYALNKSGLALTALRELPAGVPQVVDQSGITPHPGKQALPSSTVAFIQTVAYQLKAQKLSESAYVLPANAPYELDVRLANEPYDVRFSLRADALTQSGAAVATVQQLSKAGTTPAAYIDVRVPGRVYYK